MSTSGGDEEQYLYVVLSPTDIEKFLKEASDSQYVAIKEEGEEDLASRWQEESGEAQEVLYDVFSLLTGAALANAAAVCRLWRRAAETPSLWRHLLLRECKACPVTVRQLVELEAEKDEGDCTKRKAFSWRDEYVRAAAGWFARYSWQPAEGAVLEHAMFDATGTSLAIAADDASIAVWDTTENADTWSMRWRVPLETRRGWFTAARVEWSPDSVRLLAAGALHLASRWELIVLDASDGMVLARATCSAGAAGCWAGTEAFLSLELRLAAPSHATTAVWLNAATQETESEHTGVTTPLLRIYNEARTAISHTVVVDVPSHCGSQSRDGEAKPDGPRMLVVTSGIEGGERGVASSLSAWHLPRIITPPPLCAAADGDLRTRMARRRAAIPVEEEEELGEEAVRAQCTSPHYNCELASRVLGFVVDDTDGSLWVQVIDGRVLNVSLPVLLVQRSVTTMGVPPPLTPIYVVPAATSSLIAAPQHDGRVCVWTLPCAACAQSIPPPAPPASRHTSPAVTVLASRMPRCQLLVLVGPHIHVWESRATKRYL